MGIDWQPITTTEAHYTNAQYLFKRYGKDPYRYELWVGNELLDNTIRNEFEILRICRYGFESRWREKLR